MALTPRSAELRLLTVVDREAQAEGARDDLVGWRLEDAAFAIDARVDAGDVAAGRDDDGR